MLFLPFLFRQNMKIVTKNPHLVGKTVTMKNTNIAWSKDGVAEVEEEIGAKIVKDFDDIYEEGKEPEEKIVVKEDKASSKDINKLNLKISDLENKAASLLTENKSLKEKLDVALNDAKSWKAEWEKLKNGEESNPIKTTESAEKDKESESGDDYEAELSKMDKADLKAIAEEMGILDNVEDKRKPEAYIKAILEANAKGE